MFQYRVCLASALKPKRNPAKLRLSCRLHDVSVLISPVYGRTLDGVGVFHRPAVPTTTPPPRASRPKHRNPWAPPTARGERPGLRVQPPSAARRARVASGAIESTSARPCWAQLKVHVYSRLPNRRRPAGACTGRGLGVVVEPAPACRWAAACSAASAAPGLKQLHGAGWGLRRLAGVDADEARRPAPVGQRRRTGAIDGEHVEATAAMAVTSALGGRAGVRRRNRSSKLSGRARAEGGRGDAEAGAAAAERASGSIGGRMGCPTGELWRPRTARAPT